MAVVLLLAALLAARPARAQSVLSVGYQVGRFSSGLRNLDAWSLELNRAAKSVEDPMHWTNTLQGLAFRASFYKGNGFVFGIGFNNRHAIIESRYTNAASKADTRTAFRVRQNELNIEGGYAWLNGRLRPGASIDFGVYNFDRRDAPAADFSGSEWHPFHNNDGGLFSSGKRALTVGLTAFVDVAPFGKRGGGPTLRPYCQWSPLTASMFGRYGTRDEDSYEYFLSNFGLAVSWAFAFD